MGASVIIIYRGGGGGGVNYRVGIWVTIPFAAASPCYISSDQIPSAEVKVWIWLHVSPMR